MWIILHTLRMGCTIGGDVSKAGDILLKVVQKHYHSSNSKLVLAELGNDAGIYGAAKLVLQMM